MAQTKHISEGEIFPPGYSVYRKDRNNGYGGVLLAISSSLDSYQVQVTSEAEVVAAKIVNRNNQQQCYFWSCLPTSKHQPTLYGQYEPVHKITVHV